ncbi:response regulator [Cohnella sp. GCM10020058]|uniref:response regulator transcription factor n=1 Tax=Cohnella sp. GCM10020058 TaxID=3317330 RepID=UPI0036323BD0
MYRMMIVEDEPAIHRSLRKLVETSGFDVRIAGEAEDGAEALLLLEEVAPDIVVTDIRMPEMDGLAFIKAAREASPHIRFIILTGYERFDYAREALRHGVSDFLLKPIDPDQFVQTLGKLLQELADSEARHARHNDLFLLQQEQIKELAERIWATDAEGVSAKLTEVLASHREIADADTRAGQLAGHVMRSVDQELRARGYEWTGPDAAEEDQPVREADCQQWLKEACLRRLADVKGSRNFGSRQTINKAVRYIETHYAREDLSLPEVAASLGMSVSYLSRSFKEEIGVPFVQHLIGVRLSTAQRLIRETSEPTSEIAFRVGFSDYAHFSKTFKKHFGMTPSEYRKLPHAGGGLPG